VSPTLSAAPSTPALRPGATREEILAFVLRAGQVPTPPMVALEVVNAASKPDCDPKDIVAVLTRDPALCGKLLRTVNSCLYRLKTPLSSVARAVHVLGLNAVRSLALALSLPAAKGARGPDEGLREYWVSSVGGAIIARELAILRRAVTDDDLVAGLLRDMGEPLMRRAFAEWWPQHTARHAHRLVDDPCGAEYSSFGIDHADVSAEMLRGWNLPREIVEPIRHHHRPAQLAAAPQELRERAELLHFADQLVRLDSISQRPDVLEQLLAAARDRFDLPRPALVEFLQKVAPKVEEFAAVLNQDIGQCPDFGAILAAGAAELVSLAEETSRQKVSGATPAPGSAAPRTYAGETGAAPKTVSEGVLPEFRPEFVELFPEGGCRLGGLRLESPLGRGPTGTAFKAFEPNRQRHVAVKVLAPALAASREARQRFAREARAAAAVRHENVAATLAVHDLTTPPYVVTEFVDGCSLEARVQRYGALPVMLHVAAAAQIAAGLAAGHAKGVLHRDLKPSNVLIEDETGRAKLTDFGLIRVAGDEGRGAPGFAAPEVLRGAPATVASDLFSLGAVLYLMATGRPPFPGETPEAALEATVSREPAPPSQLRSNLPEWMETIILGLLAKHPDRRYASADVIASTFQSALGEPTS
jgi:HD-like signal output (HDOD) protein